MKKTDVERIKGKFYIYSNGEYVVLPNKNLYIFKTDGSMIARRDDVRFARKITFLSGSRMLLCTAKAVFHMIDLRDGSDIWTAPYVKTDLNAGDLAISPDEAFAYTYDWQKERNFICRLDLNTHEVDIHDMFMDLGATRGIACDEAGVPCLLKTHNETIGGKHFSQNGIRIHDFYDIAPGSTNCWKTKWSFDFGEHACFFFEGTDRIVTNQLQIYEPATGTRLDLLENERAWTRPGRFISKGWLDITKSYLCVMYNRVNVVIDLRERKVAAQYAADQTQGCLIGNEYWICVNDHICRKPFPAFEDAPPAKLGVISVVDYSKHPELW